MAQVPHVTDPTYEGDVRTDQGLWLLGCGSPHYPLGATFNLLLLCRPVDVSRRPPLGPPEVVSPPDPGPVSSVFSFPPGSSRGPLTSGPGSCSTVYPAAPPATALISTPRPAPAALKQAGGYCAVLAVSDSRWVHLPEGKSGAGYAEGVVARRRVSVRHGLGGPDAGPPPTCPSSLKRGLRGASRRAACWTLESKVKGLRDGRVKGLRG